MFISTIMLYTFEQSEFVKSIGIESMHCVMTDFNGRNPMEKARRCIVGCHGIIVLRFERSHVYFDRKKEDSEIEADSMHRYSLRVVWLLELGNNIFLLYQKNLYGDGRADQN